MKRKNKKKESVKVTDAKRKEMANCLSEEVCYLTIKTLDESQAKIDVADVPDYDAETIREMCKDGYDGFVKSVLNQIKFGDDDEKKSIIKTLNNYVERLEAEDNISPKIRFQDIEVSCPADEEVIKQKYPKELLLKDWLIEFYERSHNFYTRRGLKEICQDFTDSLLQYANMLIDEIPDSHIDNLIVEVLSSRGIINSEGELDEDAFVEFGETQFNGYPRDFGINNIADLCKQHTSILVAEKDEFYTTKASVAGDILDGWFETNRGMIVYKTDDGENSIKKLAEHFVLARKKIESRVVSMFPDFFRKFKNEKSDFTNEYYPPVMDKANEFFREYREFRESQDNDEREDTCH